MDQLFPTYQGQVCELCGTGGSMATYRNGEVSPGLPPANYPLLHLRGQKGVVRPICWQCVETWLAYYPGRSITTEAARRIRQINQVTDNVTAIAKLYDADYWRAVKDRLYIA